MQHTFAAEVCEAELWSRVCEAKCLASEDRTLVGFAARLSTLDLPTPPSQASTVRWYYHHLHYYGLNANFRLDVSVLGLVFTACRTGVRWPRSLVVDTTCILPTLARLILLTNTTFSQTHEPSTLGFILPNHGEFKVKILQVFPKCPYSLLTCSQCRFEYVRLFEQADNLLPNTWVVIRIDGRGFTKYA